MNVRLLSLFFKEDLRDHCLQLPECRHVLEQVRRKISNIINSVPETRLTIYHTPVSVNAFLEMVAIVISQNLIAVLRSAMHKVSNDGTLKPGRNWVMS